MKTLFSLFIALICFQISASAQTASTSAEILEAIQYRDQLKEKSLLKEFPARQIGPVVQGGRITDLVVDPRNEKVYYLGFASGGIFKTENNGQSFDPIFDGYGVLGVGDLAISPSNPDVLWVGTGENNSSRSSYAGAGMYRSTDAGKTWNFLGLAGTQHIGRVILHPTDENTAWVAAIGALYTENDERGVYKTTDGGKTWKKTLFINPGTGIIDLTIDPANPNRLWAAAWERSRKAWEFVEDGPGSGIYLSEDGGVTWNKSMTGFPEGKFTGRIGLSVCASNPKVIYAFLDNQESDPSLIREDTIAGLTLSAIGKMSKEEFLKLDEMKLDTFLKEKGYPDRYSAKQVRADLEAGTYTIEDIYSYFGDANNALFNTGVKGAEVYRSSDGGKSWNKTHASVLQGVSYTYGYYFGQVRVAPDDEDHLFIFGVPLLESKDGGKNWNRLDTTGEVHVDHHALWINPKDSKHLILGNDGGLYVSYDAGEHFTHLNNLPVGQFYTVMVDMAKPYNVYGGLQDNGVKYGPSTSIPNKTPKWKHLFGGDGMFVVTDPKDLDLAYTGFQFGHYFRINKSKRKTKYLTPKQDIGKVKYRWNWRTPMIASPHNHEILYFGSQFLFRSMNMGDDWKAISPDLTTDKKPQSNVPFSTLTTISESPLKFGLLWTGSDDGLIHVSKDGGNSWNKVSDKLPQGLWVGHIFASPHDEATAFTALSGYRSDDFHTYLYTTTDYGKTWTSLAGNLPQEPCNVIVQDPENPDLLYLGTDAATYLSLDRGKTWNYLSALPNVASYDMIVHPRENELVVATHGRSIFVLDVKPLQNLKDQDSDSPLMAYDVAEVKWSKAWGKKDYVWQESPEPSVMLSWFVSGATAPAKKMDIRILNEEEKVIHTLIGNSSPGYHSQKWNLKSDKLGKYLPAGEYQIEFRMGKVTESVTLTVKKPE